MAHGNTGTACMKYIPNCITVFRFICSVLLLFIKTFSPEFFILYILCGISDVLDGFIARKTHTVSHTGQILDSCADAVFFISMLVIYFRTLTLPVPVTAAVLVICALRLSSLAAGFIRWHKPALLHTYANKAAGFTVFCFPLLYVFLPRAAYVIVCLITGFSAAEELVINLTSKKPDLETKGSGMFIFHQF
jgi:cardiolipin synthase (CMP-forming)